MDVCRFANEAAPVGLRPNDFELLAFGVSSVADAHPNSAAGFRNRVVRVGDELNPGIARVPGLERFDGHLDSFRPFVSLQFTELTAFLKVADEHNLARSGERLGAG